jgi:hypothetical protein
VSPSHSHVRFDCRGPDSRQDLQKSARLAEPTLARPRAGHDRRSRSGVDALQSCRNRPTSLTTQLASRAAGRTSTLEDAHTQATDPKGPDRKASATGRNRTWPSGPKSWGWDGGNRHGLDAPDSGLRRSENRVSEPYRADQPPPLSGSVAGRPAATGGGRTPDRVTCRAALVEPADWIRSDTTGEPAPEIPHAAALRRWQADVNRKEALARCGRLR